MTFFPQRAVLAAVFVALGRPCLAQSDVDPQMLESLDANGDGKVSIDEVEQLMLGIAGGIPQDPQATRDERATVNSFVTEKLPALFRKVDNGDGFLSATELSELLTQFELLSDEL
eukprot:TRINITY_DN18097_c0_g1_i1.p2 TRINITY_DN18097_c0_g1~~TRINITY_DN18097_c0_g1_i1.p2  ORF type:complete len:115 (+),score=18.55 TRINITY_DN18097_c0_g1_i1:70-414(+)